MKGGRLVALLAFWEVQTYTPARKTTKGTLLVIFLLP
jgi:hypothetical protein